MCSKIVLEISVHSLIHKYVEIGSHSYTLWNAQYLSTFSDKKKTL